MHKYKYETKAPLHEGDRYYYPIRKEKEYEERAIPYYDLYPRLGARSGIHLNLYFRIPFVIDKATIEHLLECKLTTWIHKEHGRGFIGFIRRGSTVIVFSYRAFSQQSAYHPYLDTFLLTNMR